MPPLDMRGGLTERLDRGAPGSRLWLVWEGTWVKATASMGGHLGTRLQLDAFSFSVSSTHNFL